MQRKNACLDKTLRNFLCEIKNHRACLHGGRGPQVGKVTRGNPFVGLHAPLQPRHSGVHFLKICEWSLSTLTQNMAGKLAVTFK